MLWHIIDPWHILDTDDPAWETFKQSLYGLIDCSDRELGPICNYVDECDAYP